MEKAKLKRIIPILHVKMKEPRAVMSPKAYPADLKFRLLPGICKSNVLADLSADIENLTRVIKTQKPLTLKAPLK